MVVLSNAQRNDVVRWGGWSRLYKQSYPKLENAMNAIRSLAEGGTQEDDSAVLQVIAWLANLTTLETQELNLACEMSVLTAGTDKVTLDAAGRGLYGLRKLQRKYIGMIYDTLSTAIYRDVFSTPIKSPDAEEDQADVVISDYGSH